MCSRHFDGLPVRKPTVMAAAAAAAHDNNNQNAFQPGLGAYGASLSSPGRLALSDSAAFAAALNACLPTTSAKKGFEADPV